MLMAARDRENQAAMSNKELIDEVMTLIVAGHETTAAALTWTWYLISQHPDTAAALEAEADRTADGVLRARCRRVARLHPSGGAGGAATLSAGLAVHPPHDRSRRDRRLPDRRRGPMCSSAPTCCIGTRSSGAIPRNSSRSASPGVDAKERHRFAYIPFSVGPRHCIGENMAMFEMLVHVNRMSRRFRLKRADDRPIELEAQINLRPRSNLMMTVEVR